MFDMEKAKGLAELSKLEFTHSDLERIATELSRSIASAEKVLASDNEEEELSGIELNGLREDIVASSTLSQKIKEGAKLKNNCFVSKRVV